MKMYLKEVNLFTLKEKRVAFRDSADLGDQDPDEVVEQILNEDSAVHYNKLPGEDASGEGVCVIWVPDEAYTETRIYKEILVFDEEDYDE